MKKVRLISLFSLIAISLVFTLTDARAENVVNETESSNIETDSQTTNNTISNDESSSSTTESTNTIEQTTSEKSIDEILKKNREKFQEETKNKIKEDSGQDVPSLIAPNSTQTQEVEGNQKNRSKLSAAKKNLIKTRYKLRWQRVTARLNAANNRLEKIIAKIKIAIRPPNM